MNEFVYAPHAPHYDTELLEVSFDGDNFLLKSKAGYMRPARVTEIFPIHNVYMHTYPIHTTYRHTQGTCARHASRRYIHACIHIQYITDTPT